MRKRDADILKQERFLKKREKQQEKQRDEDSADLEEVLWAMDAVLQLLTPKQIKELSKLGGDHVRLTGLVDDFLAGRRERCG